MRIAVAQLDPVVGNFKVNARAISEAYTRACAAKARLLITPELGICGYPPHDLIDRPEIFERNERALNDLKKLTRGQSCALIVGHVARNPEPSGREAQNVISVLEDGKEVYRQAKMLLPTYDVFDESRYFEPAREIQPWVCDGRRIGLAICEDLWANDPVWQRNLYGRDPIESHRRNRVELMISISASPYQWQKRAKRESLHGEVAKQIGVPLLYVNQVGATDEILFDGGSFAVDSQGVLLGRLPIFRSSFGVFEWDGAASGAWVAPDASEREDVPPVEIEVLSRALVSGLKDYFDRTGFRSAIIGLSGGIDSALVAAIAVRALGAANVRGVAMPSQYSSSHSLADAEALARNLAIAFEVRPIKFQFANASRELAEGRGTLAPLALENLQSRLRGMVLMTLSNHYGSLVLTTGNKSELAMGYCTLYGDMAGALAPLGDVYKTRIYELARHINQTWGGPIPESSIMKAPSAELRPNQTDQDTLPAYDLLDEVLEEYLEKKTSVVELERRFGQDPRLLQSAEKGGIPAILRKIELSEHKRRQAAPVLRVSHKAFGIGRRIPIAKFWDQ